MNLKSVVKRRLIWWILGSFGCGVLPWLGGAFLLLLVIGAVFMIIGGLGFTSQKLPPPLPTQAAYSTQWLNLVQHVETANGYFVNTPGVVWVAAIQAASSGMPLNKTPAGGYGLYTMPDSKAMGQPLWATNKFAVDWGQHHQAFLENTLNAVGNTLQPPQSGWSSTVRSNMNALEAGPQIAAWPIANWGVKITNPASAARFGATAANSQVVWQYPTTGSTRVLATASAPIGNAYAIPWRPPTRSCVIQVHSTKPPKCTWIPHLITGRDLQGPLSMTMRLANGQTIPMQVVEGAPKSAAGYVFNHAILWTSKVPVSSKEPVTITAHWAGGISVATTLPGSGFQVGAGGPVGPTPPPGNPQTLQQIYQSHQAILQAASQATGTPISLLVGEIANESSGVNYGYRGPQYACGMFQMFSPGSFTSYAPGYPPSACAAPSVEALSAARFLAALHQEFGSWRLASASYYGGPGNVLSSQVSSGMPWSVAGPKVNWVPDPTAGNVLSMMQYADNVYADAQSISHLAHLPTP